jgi:hypothetical protein
MKITASGSVHSTTGPRGTCVLWDADKLLQHFRTDQLSALIDFDKAG